MKKGGAFGDYSENLVMDFWRELDYHWIAEMLVNSKTALNSDLYDELEYLRRADRGI